MKRIFSILITLLFVSKIHPMNQPTTPTIPTTVVAGTFFKQMLEVTTPYIYKYAWVISPAVIFGGYSLYMKIKMNLMNRQIEALSKDTKSWIDDIKEKQKIHHQDLRDRFIAMDGNFKILQKSVDNVQESVDNIKRQLPSLQSRFDDVDGRCESLNEQLHEIHMQNQETKELVEQNNETMVEIYVLLSVFKEKMGISEEDIQKRKAQHIRKTSTFSRACCDGKNKQKERASEQFEERRIINFDKVAHNLRK